MKKIIFLAELSTLNIYIMKYILVILFCIVSNLSFSQNDVECNERFTENTQYLFKKFVNSTVKFNDGVEIQANLNYNVIFEEMHFIDNDTIKALINTDIKYVILDKIKFHYINNSFYQEEYCNKNYKLIKQYNPDMSNLNNNVGAYGTSTATLAPNKINELEASVIVPDAFGVVLDDNAKEIKTNPKYYIVDSKNNMIFPTKNKIYKLSQKSKSEIETFIKENKINLDKKDDLIAILDFI